MKIGGARGEGAPAAAVAAADVSPRLASEARRSEVQLREPGLTRQPVEVELGALLKKTNRGASIADLMALAKSLPHYDLDHMTLAPGAKLPSFDGLEGEALAVAIRDLTESHQVMSYNDARRAIFSEVDNEGGWVTDVYAGHRIQTLGIPKVNDINVEHVWPQDNGIAGTRAVTDLHNLMPADREANLRRSNLPFGEVAEIEWQSGEAKLGRDAAGQSVWEPPDAVKGRVARALCYVAVTYEQPLSAGERDLFARWNREHPVTDAERQRDLAVWRLQGKPNPFVEQPELVDRFLAPGRS